MRVPRELESIACAEDGVGGGGDEDGTDAEVGRFGWGAAGEGEGEGHVGFRGGERCGEGVGGFRMSGRRGHLDGCIGLLCTMLRCLDSRPRCCWLSGQYTRVTLVWGENFVMDHSAS